MRRLPALAAIPAALRAVTPIATPGTQLSVHYNSLIVIPTA